MWENVTMMVSLEIVVACYFKLGMERQGLKV